MQGSSARTFLAAVAIAALWWPSARGATPAASPAAPAEYADLYAALDGQLAAIDRGVSVRWTGERHDVAFAAELLAANGNQGPRLLDERTWRGVAASLDAYQHLGVRAVRLTIKYPMLVAGFPRAQDYLAFYRRVVQDLRRRDLKVLVQMTDAFREPVFGALPVEAHFAGLTLDRYRREKRQMAETIIREIRPDWLTIENEPGTQQHNTGLRLGVREVTDLVRHVLDGLDRSGVRIGAGTGTWEDPAFAQSLARDTSLDYLDMHVYPINRDFVLDRVFRFAEVARRAGKRVVLGEAWLYKARDGELGGGPVAAAPALFGRDAFGFWEPLDARFVTVTAKLAHALRLDFASFFWARYFFGYVPYDATTGRLPPGELFRRANAEAARNMTADPPRLTGTGAAYQRVLRGDRF